MIAVDVVRSYGRDDEDPHGCLDTSERDSDEIREELERRDVRPLNVIDRDEEGSGRTALPERLHRQNQTPVLGSFGGCRRKLRWIFGIEDAGQIERCERLSQGRKWGTRVREPRAGADPHPHVARGGGQFVQQPRLADPGFPPQERDSRPAFGRGATQAAQRLQFGGAANERPQYSHGHVSVQSTMQPTKERPTVVVSPSCYEGWRQHHSSH